MNRKQFFGTKFLKTIVFSEWTIFLKKFWKKLSIFLMNERFYKTSDFTEKSVCEKTNNNFENERNKFFQQWKKRTKWVIHKRWTNEMKKVERADIYDNANISLPDLQRYP